jgi:hypothetical protein
MKTPVSTSTNVNGIRGRSLREVFMDELVSAKTGDWQSIIAPDGMDYDRYRRLGLMRIKRKSVWDKAGVEISLTYMPTGTESRSVLVSIEDAHASDVVLSRVINTLSLELETMIAVFSKLEER